MLVRHASHDLPGVDVLNALVARVLGMDLDAMHRFDIDPSSITTLHWWGDGVATLVSMLRRK